MSVYAFILLTRRQPSGPRTTCRRCGYDVRETPERCPECGLTVPDELRLRIDLLNGNPPAFLLSDEHALPLRQPHPGERFRSLVLLQEKHQHDQLVTLLGRAGIASESDFQIMPSRPYKAWAPVAMDPKRPRFEVRVPVADYPLAMELLHYLAQQEKQK